MTIMSNLFMRKRGKVMHNSKVIAIVCNKYSEYTRHVANSMFFYCIDKARSGGYAYHFDIPNKKAIHISEISRLCHAYLSKEITDVPFLWCHDIDNVKTIAIYFPHIRLEKYTNEDFENMIFEMKQISRKFDVDVVILFKHKSPKIHLTIKDFQRKYGAAGGIEQNLDVIISVELTGYRKSVVKVLKNKFGGLSEHYID